MDLIHYDVDKIHEVQNLKKKCSNGDIILVLDQKQTKCISFFELKVYGTVGFTCTFIKNHLRVG